MTQDDFDRLVELRVERIRATLKSKGDEYVRGTDRLVNFKQSGEFQRCTPERALLGNLSKHLVSIVNMVHDVDRGLAHDESQWSEKLGDAINYLILLEGLTADRRAKKEAFEIVEGL